MDYGKGGLGLVAGTSTVAVLPATGGNPALMVLAAAVIAVSAAIVLSSVARVASKKAHKA
jgi:hypothetical protein